MPIRSSGELKGLLILVTRPRAQAAPLAQALRAHGARVAIAPAIRIAAPYSWAPLDRALRGLTAYDIAIFTSANGVERFFERAQKVLGRAPAKPRKLYAIGPGTAQALRRRGWKGALLPERYEAGALARRLGDVKGLRILLPRARVARDILPKTLRKRGGGVDVVEAYRTVPDAAGCRRIRQTIREKSADIVTFTSASTVDHFMAAHGKARSLLLTAAAASIGPITSKALRRYGTRRIIEARVYTVSGLVRAILQSARKKKFVTMTRSS